MKKILISVISLALVVGLLGAGAFAWFSDTEVSEANTFTAGTLTMEIKDSDEGWFDGKPVKATWQSPASWMPGEEFDAIVRIRNTGGSDILYLGADLKNYQHNDQGTASDLAQVIEVVKFNKWIPGNGYWYDNLNPSAHNPSDPGYASKVFNGDATLTLEELIDSYISSYGEPAAINPGGWFWDGKGYVTHLTDFLHGDGYDGATIVGQACIPAGTTYQLELGFKFMETAGDEYQGDTCQFDIYFYGTQDTSTLP